MTTSPGNTTKLREGVLWSPGRPTESTEHPAIDWWGLVTAADGGTVCWCSLTEARRTWPKIADGRSYAELVAAVAHFDAEARAALKAKNYNRAQVMQDAWFEAAASLSELILAGEDRVLLTCESCTNHGTAKPRPDGTTTCGDCYRAAQNDGWVS